MEEKNYYKILGVDKKATKEQIKKAFRKKSMIHHPDKQINKSEEEKKKSEEEFKLINIANEVLSDPEKRKLYDQFGEGLGKNQGYGQPQEGDLHDFIRRQQEAFFGGMNQRPQGDLQITINITLEECYNGLTKKVKYIKQIICDDCNGSGADIKNGGKKIICPHCQGTGMETSHRQGFTIIRQTCRYCGGFGSSIDKKCHTCNGSGLKQQENTIDIEIPKGVINGMATSNIGGGNEYLSQNGSKGVGNLNIVFREIRHSKFERDPSNPKDLHVIVNINVIDAILGESVIVDSIDGKKYKLKINQGCSDGDTYRLSGVGMPLYGYGDTLGSLYCHASIQIPKGNLTSEEIKLLKKLKNEKNFK